MVILLDKFNIGEDIFEIIFDTEQQIIVVKLLIEEMKVKEGEIGKTEMSMLEIAHQEGRMLVRMDTKGAVQIIKQIKQFVKC